MKGEKELIYIEAIKLAAGSVQYKDISISETFILAVRQLYHYYEESGNKNYLETGVLHIRAYLEMGFSYEKGKEIFDTILRCLDTDKETQFPKKFYVSKVIKLNKSQIRTMIKKWPASPHQQYKIDDLVLDIMEKVKKCEIGIYYYKCAVTGDIYELVISEAEVFFHDIRRGLFYTFMV